MAQVSWSLDSRNLPFKSGNELFPLPLTLGLRVLAMKSFANSAYCLILSNVLLIARPETLQAKTGDATIKKDASTLATKNSTVAGSDYQTNVADMSPAEIIALLKKINRATEVRANETEARLKAEGWLPWDPALMSKNPLIGGKPEGSKEPIQGRHHTCWKCRWKSPLTDYCWS